MQRHGGRDDASGTISVGPSGRRRAWRLRIRSGEGAYENNLAPDVIAGVSIGAVTAVLLARPANGKPLDALAAFSRKGHRPGRVVPTASPAIRVISGQSAFFHCGLEISIGRPGFISLELPARSPADHPSLFRSSTHGFVDFTEDVSTPRTSSRPPRKATTRSSST